MEEGWDLVVEAQVVMMANWKSKFGFRKLLRRLVARTT